MNRWVKKAIPYGLCALFTWALAAFYISQREFAEADRMTQYLILCDAFTVPGLLMLMLGGLLWVLSLGALDGIAYALSYAVRMLIPGAKYRHERYFDYVERQNGKRVKGYGFLLISGGVVMAIALVFMVLFYQLYGK